MLGTNRGRPFWISDAIVLVAATACGLALRPSVHWMDSELIPIVFTAARIRNGLQAWADELAPILGAWTLALALLSLRSPRLPPIVAACRVGSRLGCVDRPARPHL